MPDNAGIIKATILDSEGMGKFLAYEIPFFAGLRELLGEESKQYNKTIMALTDGTEKVRALENLCREIGLDFRKNGPGIMFSVQVSSVVSTNREKSES